MTPKFGKMNEIPLKCRNCGEIFSSRSDLMDHRKHMHLSTIAYCQNYTQGTCPFSSKMCWWNHAAQDEIKENHEEIFKCYICSENFENKRTMIIHRKMDHVVRDCYLYLDNKCRYSEDSCWFSHVEKVNEEDKKGNIDESSESVFREVRVNLEPPIENH